jgi:hypothetical protein
MSPIYRTWIEHRTLDVGSGWPPRLFLGSSVVRP